MSRRTSTRTSTRTRGFGGDRENTPPSNLERLANQKANYDTRLEGVGINPEPISDGKNSLQRFLGLEADTGVIMGTLELLNRPANALAGAFQELGDVAEIQDSGNLSAQDIQAYRDSLAEQERSPIEKMMSGLKKGLTGEKNYHWGQVLRNTFEDGRKEDGETDWTDIVGLALDMTLDPVQLALFATTGGAGNVALATADTAGDLGKIAKTAKAVDTTADSIKVATAGMSEAQKASRLGHLKDIWKGGYRASTSSLTKGTEEFVSNYRLIKQGLGQVGKGVSTIGAVTDPNFWIMPSRFRNEAYKSVSGVVFSTAGKGIKTAGQKAKSAFEVVAERNPDNIGALKGVYDDTMKSVKSFILRSDSDLEGIRGKSRRALSEMNKAFEVNAGTYTDTVAKIMEDAGGTIEGLGLDEIQKYVAMERELTDVSRLFQNTEDFIQDIVWSKDNVSRTFNNTPDMLNSLKNLFPSGTELGNYGINVTEDFIKFDSTFWSQFKSPEFNLDDLFNPAGVDGALDKLANKNNLLNDWTAKDIRFGTKISLEDQDFLAKLRQNKFFGSIKREYDHVFTEAQKEIGATLFGNPNALIEKGYDNYVPHTLNPDMKSEIERLQKLIAEQAEEMEKTVNPDVGDLISTSGGIQPLKSRKILGTASDANLRIQETWKDFFSDNVNVNALFDGMSAETVAHYEDLLTNTDWFMVDARVNLLDLMSTKSSALANAQAKSDILLMSTFGQGAVEGRSGLALHKAGEIMPAGAEVMTRQELINLKSSLKTSQRYTPQGIDGGELASMFEERSKFSDDLIKIIDQGISGKGEVVLDKRIKRLVGTTTKTDAGKVLDTVDKLMGSIRSNKLLSPGFNAKNVLGNTTNMYLSGMPLEAITEQIAYADDIIKFAETGADIMTAPPRLQEGLKLYKEMLIDGSIGSDTFERMEDIAEYAEGLGLSKLKDNLNLPTGAGKDKNTILKYTDKIKETNMGLNQAFDDRSRLAIALHAQNNPSYMEALGVVRTPIEASKFVMFDPNDLTNFEKDIVKRGTMFYTFARQNVMFHAKNLLNNSDRYYDLYKRIKAINEGANIGEGEESQWDGPFDITVGGKGDKYTTLRAGNPFEDFVDFTQNPLKTMTNMTNPFLKAPVELTTGKRIFDGRDIESNAKGRFDYLVELSGFDVPGKAFENLAKTAIAGAQGDPGQAAQNLGVFLNVSRERSKESNLTSTHYRQIERLQKFFQDEKKKGNEIPTIAELKAKGLLPKK